MERALDDTLRWQRVLPGFGHSVYKNGDARFTVLLQLFEQLARPDQVELVGSLIDVARAHTIPLPNVDLGLAAIAWSTGMPAGRRADPVHGGPGGRLGGPLSRGAGRAAAALPGPGRLRLARRELIGRLRHTGVAPCSEVRVAEPTLGP